MGPEKMLIVRTPVTWCDCCKVDICVRLHILGEVYNEVCGRLSVAVHGRDGCEDLVLL